MPGARAAEQQFAVRRERGAHTRQRCADQVAGPGEGALLGLLDGGRREQLGERVDAPGLFRPGLLDPAEQGGVGGCRAGPDPAGEPGPGAERGAQLGRGEVGVGGGEPGELAGQRGRFAGRQGDRGPGAQCGDEHEEGAAQDDGAGARVDQFADGAQTGGQTAPGVHHGARAGGGAGGEDDDGVGVARGCVGAGDARHRRAEASDPQPGCAAGQSAAEGGDRAEHLQRGQGEVGAAGQRPGPAGHRLGGGVGEDQVRAGQREPGGQDVGARGRVEDGDAQAEPVRGEHDGERARAGAQGEAEGGVLAEAAGVQGDGVGVGEGGEFAPMDPDAGAAEPGVGQDGGAVGVPGAQVVGEPVEHGVSSGLRRVVSFGRSAVSGQRSAVSGRRRRGCRARVRGTSGRCRAPRRRGSGGWSSAPPCRGGA